MRTLYHGTSYENALSILKGGLVPGGKRGSFVSYLTPNVEIAKKYGEVVLKIDATGLRLSAFEFLDEILCWDFIPSEKIELFIIMK